MSNLNNRLTKLEKRADEQPLLPPRIIEIWGTREDGTRYLIETWEHSMNALADALEIPRADLDTELQELRDEQTNQQN